MSRREATRREPMGVPGVVHTFAPGDEPAVERALEDLRTLGIRRICTEVDWKVWQAEGGSDWYDWLIPRLAREVEVLPRFTWGPLVSGIVPRVRTEMRRPREYTDWVQLFVTRFAAQFDHVELWDGCSAPEGWDHREHLADWAEALVGAALFLHDHGKRTVLSITSAQDPHWLDRVARHGVLEHVDVVGVRAIADRHEDFPGWATLVDATRQVLAQHGRQTPIWLTGAGRTTAGSAEASQLRSLAGAVQAGALRVYWDALYDGQDERGLFRAPAQPKLAARLWQDEGLEAVREHAEISSRPLRAAGAPVAVVTGGAGFIGSNVANRLLEDGWAVVLLDNLSRPGVERNARWLRDLHGDRVRLELGDLRDPRLVHQAVGRADRLFHFAAQVAVTTSLDLPLHDFEVNARGTLNVLEALRARKDPPPAILTSTNKVYGGLPDVGLRMEGARWEPEDEAIRAHGIGESRPLDFHSPYGCSKGSADQYFVDYARTFDLPATVFRMSCIYGPRQFGTEDQGWVAHFLMCALRGRPITIYGDGAQVRDVLFVDDLVNAFLLAMEDIDAVRGQAFNVGGGPANTLSLHELIDAIEAMHGERPRLSFEDWRPGDQRWYVSDTRALQDALGWRPTVDVEEGLQLLYRWLIDAEGRSERKAMVS